MIRRISALMVSMVVCLNLAWVQPAMAALDYSYIRVALASMGTPQSVKLKVEGRYSIPELSNDFIDMGDYEIFLQDGQLVLQHGTTFQAMGNRFSFKRHEGPLSECLRILNSSYGWTKYLGDMEVRIVDEGIRLINHIDLETYLYGVVPYEMSNSWPLEALKAQAVAARTYAVRCKRALSYFDLYDTEYSQVYRGYDPSKGNAIRAVNETAGMVLKYGTEFACTYYSSSNGGKVESVANLWGEDIPYLTVRDDPFDKANPNNRNATWTVEYSRITVDPELQTRLKVRLMDSLEAKGYSSNLDDITIKQIKEISFAPPNDSGRMTQGVMVVVVDAKKQSDGSARTFEETIRLDRNNIRSILGLKSLLFTLEEKDDRYIFHGGGYGHGVGMSQYGAQQMAVEGFTFAHILGFYYPGTQFELLPATLPSRGDDPQAPSGDNQPQQPGSDDPQVPDEDISEQPEQPEQPGSEDPQAPDGDDEQQPQQPDDNGSDPVQPEPIYGRVNVSTSLNVRQGPGLQYSKIGSFNNNTRVQVLEKGPTWYKVRAGELEGYIHGDYVILEDDGQAPPQNPGNGQAPVAPEDPAPPPTDRRYGIVTASALNVRSGPSTRNHKVGMVIRGTKVTVTEAVGEWYKVDIDGLEGYVHGGYLDIEEGEPQIQPEIPPEIVPGKAMVKASTLNVRSGAGTEYQRIGSLARDTEIVLLNQQGIWYKVRYGNIEGYVHGGYLEIIKDPSVAREGVVTASTLNIRNGPGLTHQRIGLLHRGARVTILEEVDGWYRIQDGPTSGYVYGEYVDL